MNPVVQEEPTGCGIASVAALAGVSYETVRQTAAGLGIHAYDTALWSDTEHVRRLLGAFGLGAAPDERPFSSWEALPDCCLLAIKWRLTGEKAFWHWTVFHRGEDGPVVLDPKKTLQSNIRRDFGRMKPKWHIPVFKE